VVEVEVEGRREGGGGAQMMRELSAEEERSWREEVGEGEGEGGEKWREVTQLSWPWRRAEKEREKLEVLQFRRGVEKMDNKERSAI